MHSWTFRLNAIFTFTVTVLAVLSALNALSVPARPNPVLFPWAPAHVRMSACCVMPGVGLRRAPCADAPFCSQVSILDPQPVATIDNVKLNRLPGSGCACPPPQFTSPALPPPLPESSGASPLVRQRRPGRLGGDSELHAGVVAAGTHCPRAGPRVLAAQPEGSMAGPDVSGVRQAEAAQRGGACDVRHGGGFPHPLHVEHQAHLPLCDC